MAELCGWPYLGQERREVVHNGGVEVVVDGEQVPLWGELSGRLLISLPYSVFLASSSVICRVSFHHACSSHQRRPPAPMDWS